MSPSKFSEDALVEQPALALLADLGFEVIDGFSEQFGSQHVGAGGLGRDDQAEVVLRHRLRPKLVELILLFGEPRLVVLNRLKNSLRNSTLEPSRGSRNCL